MQVMKQVIFPAFPPFPRPSYLGLGILGSPLCLQQPLLQLLHLLNQEGGEM